MEQSAHTPELYDYRTYDRIWQRVAPGLEPYPPERSGEEPAAGRALTSPGGENALPGASENPCCMGSAALEMLDVLVGFLEAELSDRRHTLALLQQAPLWAKQPLREIAGVESEHAGKLMAAYYLMTGECYRPAVHCERIYIGRWCPALRERYHTAACEGLNYARAAEGTTDPCLRRLLNALSEEEYRNADALMRLLTRALQG